MGVSSDDFSLYAHTFSVALSYLELFWPDEFLLFCDHVDSAAVLIKAPPPELQNVLLLVHMLFFVSIDTLLSIA